jgi:hypothetical protein
MLAICHAALTLADVAKTEALGLSYDRWDLNLRTSFSSARKVMTEMDKTRTPSELVIVRVGFALTNQSTARASGDPILIAFSLGQSGKVGALQWRRRACKAATSTGGSGTPMPSLALADLAPTRKAFGF